MASDSPAERQQVLLVTGMLGAGKTTALHELEDLGWEVIDNFPIRLLDRLVGEDAASRIGNHPLAIGFDSRTRGFVPSELIEQVKQLAERDDLTVTTLFLDCSTAELERRYDETRRRHHLAQDMPVSEGIIAERELLAPLRRWADMLVDTTRFSTRQLQEHVREQFSDAAPDAMTVTITSFGFARGMPPNADLIFDMRYLDNPHWQPELRELTGQDDSVGKHIMADPAFPSSFAKIRDLLIQLLPRYSAHGKRYVTIAFGCTGGRHRSVYTAEEMAKALREAGFSPTVLHRNLGSRAAELIEGPQHK
jgi:UPF0042 nucleotide-binding protein